MSSQNRFKSFNHLLSKTPPNLNKIAQFKPCSHTPAVQNNNQQSDTPIKDLMNIKKNKTQILQKVRFPTEFQPKHIQKHIEYINYNKCLNCLSISQQSHQLKVKLNQITSILNQQRQNTSNFHKSYKLLQQQLQMYRSQKQNSKLQEQNLKTLKLDLDNLNKKNRELMQENSKINKKIQEKNFLLQKIQIKYEKLLQQLKLKEDQIINYKWMIQKFRDEDQKTNHKNRPLSSNKSSLETSINSDKKKRSESTANKKDINTIKQNKIAIDLNKLWTNGIKNYNSFVSNNSKVFLYK